MVISKSDQGIPITLEQLGTRFGYRSRFELTGVPDVSGGNTIDVAVDGVPIPPVDASGNTQWLYNSNADAIDFESSAIPWPGATVTVTYHPPCIH